MKAESEFAGIHCFERAGLGKAPFQFIGYEYKTYQACPDAPIQPGGSCHYCGQAIMNICTVKSSDGKVFHVGPDCINKVGDAGVYKAYRTSKAYRERQRHIRVEKSKVERTELDQLLANTSVQEKLNQLPHPYPYWAEQGKTMLGYVDFMARSAGMKGIHDALRMVKKVLLTTPDPSPADEAGGSRKGSDSQRSIDPPCEEE